jgi:hypothetical protein
MWFADFLAAVGVFLLVLIAAAAIAVWWVVRAEGSNEIGDADPNDGLPPLKSQFKPYVPPPWQFSDDDLRDPTPHEPAP